MTQRRAIAYILMGYLILHHLLSNEYTSFDRFLEMGVFLLILYEVAVGILDRWTGRRRKNLLSKRRAALSEFVARGDKLRHDTPDVRTQPGYPWDWLNAVDSWTSETAEFLARYSSNAGTAFTLIRQSNLFIGTVELPNALGRSFPVESRIREAHQRLVAQMSNLAEIIEQADLYF